MFRNPKTPTRPTELRVKVISAKNLIAADSNVTCDGNFCTLINVIRGKSDPFAVVLTKSGSSGKDKSIKTKKISETLNPTWNETFNLILRDRKDSVVIEVWDDDLFGKDHLGTAEIPLEAFEHDKEISLVAKLNKQGEVSVAVTVRYNDQELEELQKKEEEEKKRIAAEAQKKKEEDEKRIAAEAQKKAEDDRKKKEEDDRKKAEEDIDESIKRLNSPKFFVKNPVVVIEREAKILIVGDAQQGKSALVQSICGKDRSASTPTEGVEVSEWVYERTRFSFWDFAGQELYYVSHPLFLSDNSIYLLVWNMRNDFSKEKLEYWLNSIKLKAPDSTVLIVATHLDQISVQIPEKLSNQFCILKGCIQVSCTEMTNIDILRNKLVQLTKTQMIELNPEEQKFLQAIKDEKLKKKPWIEGKLTELAPPELLQEGNMAKIQQALKKFHNMGAILYYAEVPALQSFIVLDPNWLINLAKSIINVKNSKHVLTRTYSTKSDLAEVTNQQYHSLAELLVHLGLVIPVEMNLTVREIKYVVPCLLAQCPDEIAEL